MLTLVLPLGVAILAAMLLSRSLTAGAREPVRWWPLVVLALGIDLVLARIPSHRCRGLSTTATGFGSAPCC
jgi:hypothetical protein